MNPADLCAVSAVIYAALTGTYHEARMVTLVQDASVIEIWAAPGSETWTIVQTKPTGESCILATGTGVMFGVPAPAGDPA